MTRPYEPLLDTPQEEAMRTITTTIDLDATPEEVWDALTDTAAYPQWNPFITQVAGTLDVGSRVQLRVAPPGGKPMTFRPIVTAVEPEHRLAWLGRLLVPGVFDGAHSFTLQPTADGRTRLVHSESFRGVLVWFSGGLLDNTAAGFEAMNEALRERLRMTTSGDPHGGPSARNTPRRSGSS